MQTWKIELHRSVTKYISALQPSRQRCILAAIYKLPQGDVAPMKRRKGEFRLRIGDWRVLFEYRDGDTIFVMEIDSRGDVYK